jgi:hypothetical protein
MKYLVFGLVALGACGDSGDDDSGLAAGTYFGDLIVQDSADARRSVFSSAEIAIDDNGRLEGTMLTETPTTVANDPGVVVGTVVPSAEPYMIDIDLDISFDQSGSYTASGFTTFTAGQRSISSNLVTRDANGAVIGMTTIVWQQE